MMRPTTRGEKIMFDNLTPLYPNKRLRLEYDSRNYSTRIVDMLAPIGKGTALPDRFAAALPAKTVLLQDIAHAITANHPEAY